MHETVYSKLAYKDQDVRGQVRDVATPGVIPKNWKTMASPFNPPAKDLPGKPAVREWIPPPVTKQTENFATLKSIDLSLLDSNDPAIVEGLVQKVKTAIRDDGFLFLENYGVSLEQVDMLVHRQISSADKLQAPPPVCVGPVFVREHKRRGQRAPALRSGHRSLVGL